MGATVSGLAEPGDPPGRLVEAALDGDEARAAAIMGAAGPEAGSLAARLALADAGCLAELHPSMVNQASGPYGWPPLLYLCNSRYRADDEACANARLEIAKALTAMGADANAGARESETIRGYRTALGAAIGRARSPALASHLLDAGADVADGPTLYEGSAMWEAVRHRDEESLKLLLAAGPPQWHVCHALPHCLRFDDVDLVDLLLEHDGDPNWNMGTWGFKGTCLHESVVLDNRVAILERLLDKGARVDARDRGGRTALALATCLNREDHAVALRRHGARDSEVRNIDRWIAACFAGDVGDALQRAAPAALTEVDHVWLCRAIRDGNTDAVPLLLGGGADPDAVDDDGERALHLAAARGAVAVVERLLAEGADVHAINYGGETPVDVCRRVDGEACAQVAALLLPLSPSGPSTPFDEPAFAAVFERAADAVVAGDLDTLAVLLRDHPELARARSSRPHRCTLLHYLGANGVEGERQTTPANAVRVIELLLAAGSDPNASCYTYRGGPDESTVGLLTSSGHPRDAGLTVSMVAALAKGGARVDETYTLLADLADGRPADAIDAFDPHSELAARALVESATLRETKILFALIDAGVDVNARRHDGATALHQAAIDGDARLVEELIKRGADLRLRDKVYDGTPAGWAFAGGHDALGKRLAARLEDD